LLATTAMLIALSAECSIAQDNQQTELAPEPGAPATIPDVERIKADLIGNFMYVSDGLPAFWEFSSASTIQNGSIGSTRREGDLLEFNFTLVLADHETKDRGFYRADTVILYKEVAGSWEFIKVQGNSIRKVGTGDLTMQNNFQDGC